MSKLIPIATGTIGTATIVAGGGYLLSTQNTTIRSVFKNAIIDLENEAVLVNSKLAKLNVANDVSEQSIFKLAQKAVKSNANNKLEEFKKACNKIYDSSFIKKDSPLFEDFKSYCARTNKDKIQSGKWSVDISETQWGSKHTKLKNPKSSLIAELSTIANETDAEGNKLKAWCQKAGDLVFEGQENRTFKNIEEFCTKEN